ncbi:hypothetical protein AMAG_13865 [Allomyces macrogynus ATCC 38327]|uniref:Abasic site processing protein n=1 Tax=Allomyces macrogynus (strain ATCC 38327) TaxID=578462 RepID=A0A0L0T2N7_ALLM3|nr:hypothetical protein AMAG_13865 [Allomyces macrogynus ATCC 38327]|eukprot:KNE68991.1 hypothetical protein AMAG_13865 [Allomyces macrogynus ATCC 38327]
MCGRIALNVNAAQPVVVHRGGAAECGARPGEEYVVAMAHLHAAGVTARVWRGGRARYGGGEGGNEESATAVAGSADSKYGSDHAVNDSSEQDAYALFFHGVHTETRATGLAPINARDDSLTAGKPIFAKQRHRHRHRCVVVAQGFYEWVNTKKTPNYRLLCMAGLFTIVATENTPKLAFLNDRMPVLLTIPRAIRTWLDPNPRWGPALETVMREGRNDDGLVWYAVDPRVGKVGLCRAVHPETDGG